MTVASFVAMSDAPAGFVLVPAVLVPPVIGRPGDTKQAAVERLKNFLQHASSDRSIIPESVRREDGLVLICYAKGVCGAGKDSWKLFKATYQESIDFDNVSCQNAVKWVGKTKCTGDR